MMKTDKLKTMKIKALTLVLIGFLINLVSIGQETTNKPIELDKVTITIADEVSNEQLDVLISKYERIYGIDVVAVSSYEKQTILAVYDKSKNTNNGIFIGIAKEYNISDIKISEPISAGTK